MGGGSVRLIRLRFLRVISFRTAAKQLKPWGFVHCRPPPSPPLPHLPPLHPRMNLHVVTFLAVKDNTKVIFIFVKALSCFRASFPKAGYCWGGRQPPRPTGLARWDSGWKLLAVAGTHVCHTLLGTANTAGGKTPRQGWRLKPLLVWEAFCPGCGV